MGERHRKAVENYDTHDGLVEELCGHEVQGLLMSRILPQAMLLVTCYV